MLRRRKRPGTFTAGEEVEVRCDDEGLKGAWYEARVVGHLPKRRRYTVVYNSLTDEADESRPLEEAVTPSHIRPRPPPPRNPDGGRIGLHQPVDAFYNDGWWSGVVSKVPREQESGMYTVRFPKTRDVMAFRLSELRPHLDWVDREWVEPQTQDMRIRSGKLAGAKVDNIKQRSRSIADKPKLPPTVRRLSDGDKALTKLPIHSTNSEIKKEPCSTSEKGETIEDNTRLIDCLAKLSKTSDSLKTRYIITMPALKMEQFEGVVGNEQQCKVLVSADQIRQGEVRQCGDVRELKAGKKRRKKVIPRKIKIIDTKASSEGYEPKQLDGKADEQVEEEVDMSFTLDSCSISDEIQSICHGIEGRNHADSTNHEVGDRQDNRPVGDLSREGHSASQTGAITQGDLKIDDPRDRYDEKVKTLAHLEEHGFDVQHAQARLAELLCIKSKHEQLVEKRSALEVVRSEKEKGKDRLDAEMEAVEKAGMALKQALAHFYEKKASLLKQREDNDSDMARLESDVRAVEEIFCSAECEFEGVLARML